MCDVVVIFSVVSYISNTWNLTLRKCSSSTTLLVFDELSQVATLHLSDGSCSFSLPTTFNRDMRVFIDKRRFLWNCSPEYIMKAQLERNREQDNW